MTTIERTIRRDTGSDFLIGRYCEDTNGNGFFTDIRGEEGDVFTSEEIANIQYNGHKLKVGEFYKFKWVLLKEAPITLAIDGEVSEIDKPTFLELLYDAKANLRGSNREFLINNQENIFKEVTGAEHTYIYELLQNANDYPSIKENNIVKVKFVVTPKYLLFLHTGEEFNLKNITAICSVNQGEKKKNTKTIGYKGIGFKTVFVNNDYVYLHSGEWQMRFDRSYVENNVGKRAWAFMPIPTQESDLDSELQEAIRNYKKDYRVFFALRHSRNDATENIPQLDKVFSDSQILLFIPNVYDVSVIALGEEKYHVSKDKNKWTISQFEWKIPAELHDWVKEDIKRGGKVPPKFEDIDSVSISFAAARRGNFIQPVEDARVYNYLPTELRLGFKFLINADFVPNGARNNLHPTHWNDEVMTQCGNYFVKWWTSLLENEDQWDINSVFSILPEFNSSESYSKKFMMGFKHAMREAECIPVKINGEYFLSKISDITWDDLFLTSGDKPMFTDEEFYVFTGTEGILPAPSIRRNVVLQQILKKDFKDICHLFSGNSLGQLCTNEKFKNWLKNKDNNIRFNQFILENDWMSNLTSNKILLSANGKLEAFNKLYYDIDSFIENLPLVISYIDSIHPELRDAMKKSNKWGQFLGCFRRFNSTQFANEIVSVYKQNPSAFLEEKNNVGFIKVLAQLGVQASNYIPSNFKFITTEGKYVEETKYLYILSEFGQEFINQTWVDKNSVDFLSEKYFDKNRKSIQHFLESAAIHPLTISTIYQKYLCPEDKNSFITKKIEDKEANIQFYRFLALTAKMDGNDKKFDQKMKARYSLFATDGDKEYSTLMSTQMFFRNEEWEETIKQPWMPNALCLALSEEYTQGLNEDDTKKMIAFFQGPQIVTTFSIGSLCNIIRTQKNFQTICEGIVDKETSKLFLQFLFNSRKQLFKGEQPSSMYMNIPLEVDGFENLTCINELHGRCYYHNSNLDLLLSQNWADELAINLCSTYYDDLFYTDEQKKFYDQLGVHHFDLIEYTRRHILAIPNKFKSTLSDKDTNVSFHKFIYTIHQKLSGEDLEKVQQFPIFISSPEKEEGELVDKARNHYLPSTLLNEIIKLDIVPISILDCIHPDYISNSDERSYYAEKLGNVEIEKEAFVEYIVKEGNLPDVTSYLKDVNRNIKFWRWVCDSKSSSKINNKLSVFPMLGHRLDSIVDEFLTPRDLFISSSYSSITNLESLITEFASNPYFVSDAYQEDSVERNWSKLFKDLYVTVDTKEIVFKHILPNLERFTRCDIIELIADHQEDISSRLKDNDKELKKQLASLNIKCIDGRFRKPIDTILSGKYFDFENNFLSDVVLNNLISEDYLSSNNSKIKRLLISISDACGNVCDTQTAFRNKKINTFLKNQELYEGDSHLRIINELAGAYINDPEGIRDLMSTEIKLKDITGQRYGCSTLYLSSSYMPNCDFMSHGITKLHYVSSDYIYDENIDDLKRFFTFLNIRSEFSLADLHLLSNSEFARYFWNVYAPKNKYLLEPICTKENLHELQCIPSPLGNKRPSELYNYRNPQLQKIVLALPNGADKLPNINLPEWLEYIGLRNRLYISDCLEYLNIETINFRRDVIRWITETNDDVIQKHRSSINEYIKNAKWINGQKNWVPLSSLVALEWGNNTLIGNFSSNDFVCNPSYMPESQQDFNRICKIFKIKILSNNDFKKVKTGEWKTDEAAKTEIRKRLLYLSYRSGKNDWKHLYDQRQTELSRCDVCSCQQIDYRYNDYITTDLTSYTDENNKLWYIGKWNGSMFLDVLQWVVRVFKITGLDDSYLKKLFLEDFNSFLKKHEHDLPTNFLSMLDDEDREGLMEDDNETAEEFTEEESSTNKLREDLNRPGMKQETSTEEPTNDPKSEEGIKTENGNYKTSNVGRTIPSNESERKTRSDKGQTHQKRAENVKTSDESDRTKASNDHSNHTTDQSVEDKLKDKWEKKAQREFNRPASGTRNTDYFDPEQNNTYEEQNEMDFSSEEDNYNSSRSRNEFSSAKSKLKRKNTEARDHAEKAQTELEISELLERTPKYTFLWFKYLMELIYAEKSKLSVRSTRLDFFGKDIICDGKALHLYNPSIVVPRWIENTDNLEIFTYKEGVATRIDATIINVSEISVDILLDEASDINELIGCSMFRIQATDSMNIIDSLNTRFIQLGYDDDFNMNDNLPKNIRFIYGPPGTGKTTKLVSDLHDIIARAKTKTNILVVTPTNKAADVIAKKLANDDLCYSYLSRYGSTEDPSLIEEEAIVTTRDTMDMDLYDHNIMVTTIARYSYDTILPDDTFICDYHWDYIVVDEASMINIVNMAYLLHKSFDSEFIIAGDPNQIQPIAENNFEIENIYQMVGISNLKLAITNFKRYPIEALLTQYRSIPTIGKVVSDFAYDGLISAYDDRAPQKPLNLDGISINTINFLGFEVHEFDNLFELGAINGSAIHLYSAIFTYNMARYVANQLAFKYKGSHYTIGIVSPYAAEAQAIKQMIEERPINCNECTITCGTVHSFQGDECDIMFVVMNPPQNISEKAHINNENIINVAMSRARDYLFFVLPNAMIKGFRTKIKLGKVVNPKDRATLNCRNLEKVIFGENDYIKNHTSIRCHQQVNVYYEPTSEYEIRLDDTTMDIKINEL